MTTIIGTGEVGALHSREELEEMQRLPLQRKIQITTARIIEWYQHYDGKVYKVVYDYTYHNFFCQDGLTWEGSQVGNWLQPVFKDGKLLRIYTLDEVRKNLHEGNF